MSKIAPRGPGALSPNEAASPSTSAVAGSFACYSCAARKTKCDKQRPECGACKRRQARCVYENVANTGLRKRKATEDANSRLKRFERVLVESGLVLESNATKESTLGENTTVDKTTDDAPSTTAASRTDRPVTTPQAKGTPETPSDTGRLILDGNKSRYVNSTLWREFEDQDTGDVFEDDAVVNADLGSGILQPASLSGGMLGSVENVAVFLPSLNDTIRLFDIYADNVEPLYKFLHLPSAREHITTALQDPLNVRVGDQCLFFAIFLLAIFSMTDDDCLNEFGQPRTLLLRRFDHCVRQSLFNASWLSTNQMSVLVAFVMYLSVLQRQPGARASLWIWTGVGTRLMQRMGIHRDGETMGLGYFDTELRRRLYWNLVVLDTYAGRVSQTADSGPPSTWNTKVPSNIDDDQIRPGMTGRVRPRTGASDMMYSLVRIKLTKLFTDESPAVGQAVPSWHATENLIDGVENEIETEFLRYCDPAEPVHAATLTTARSALASARLRQRIGLLTNPTRGRDADPREVFSLARRIMDADVYNFTNPVVKPFAWHLQASFRWEALMCLLIALARPNLFTAEEQRKSWKRIDEFFDRRPELLKGGSKLFRNVCRMTLKSWTANPAAPPGTEPGLIAMLRGQESNTPENSTPLPTIQNRGSQDTNVMPGLVADDLFDLDMFLNNTMAGNAISWESLFGASNQ